MTHDSTPQNLNGPSPADDRAFDLLVDGELSEARRRELLSTLDSRPDGWRRCALAFLEAQSWRRELAGPAWSMGESTSAAASKTSKLGESTPRSRSRRRSPGWVGTLLGMAASLLLGVGVTSLIRDLQRADLSGVAPSGQLATMTAGPSTSLPAPRRDNMQVLHLAASDPSGSRRSVALPAVARDRLDEEWLQNAPSAIPDEVVQAFEHAGHDVRTSRQLVPFPIKDGRCLMVPVDQLDVHYVNNPTYQ